MGDTQIIEQVRPEPPSPRKWPRRLLGLAVFCFLLSAFCFAFRAPLLSAAATTWIINEPAAHADAIVILGGGLEYRPFEAARLYTNGCAKTILITQPELPPTAQLGLTVPEFVLARQVLLKLGVPENAIRMIGTNVTSTRDEAVALKAWVAETKAHSVVIPPDIFHTRRVRWIFQRAFCDTPVEVHVLSVAVPGYDAHNWWKHEEGLIAFQNEVIKFAYYHLKY